MYDILFVCTANINRSPMAERLFAHHVGPTPDLGVSSAGLMEGGRRATDGAVTALAPRGLDLTDHVSRTLVPDLVAQSDLVLGLAREHLRAAALMTPGAFDKTYTLKEFVRLAPTVGVRAGVPLSEWLAKLSVGRDPSSLLGESTEDDVFDPIGRGQEQFEQTAAELDHLVRATVAYAFS